mgnify:CR=1 FL=1
MTQPKSPTLLISEVFGPTIQGEGVEAGRACVFIRTQGCPVHCPGCDTHYTWDGSEKGTQTPVIDIITKVEEIVRAFPGCGVVLSGGEPLMHYKSAPMMMLLSALWDRDVSWISLETSGYIGKEPIVGVDRDLLEGFLRMFSTVHWSPKITPCLHGRYTDAELMTNGPAILDSFVSTPEQLAIKCVVKNEEDIAVVEAFDRRWCWSRRGHRVYLMPYGIEADEMIAISKTLVPHLARTGYILTPRIHTLLWGSERQR